MDKSIGLYFHVPFCKSKCYYCDFNSYSGMDYLAGSYFDALYSELDRRLDTIEDRPVRSIFIGGGTPSLVEPKYITRLLELCSKHLQLDGEAEISMESNPGTLNFENLKAYKQAGVNRLSIGLQAWQNRLLKELGRIHDRDQFVKNIEAACKAGFSNINADLIFGLPGQSFEDWKETLEAVTSLKHADGSPVLKHLSCYDLKIEEGTVLGDRLKAGTLTAAEDELDRRMYQYTIEMLSDKGFHQYEISNFARPGYECRHNLVYWKAQEYAGFGAGSHSYLDGYRFSNVSGIESYISAVNSLASPEQPRPSKASQQKPGKASQYNASELAHNNANGPAFAELHEDIQFIDRKEAMSEFMILGLRLTKGICEAEFQERFGESLESFYKDRLKMLADRGLIAYEAFSYRLTPLGLDLANKVFVEFI